jgi:hypothetical protein
MSGNTSPLTGLGDEHYRLVYVTEISDGSGFAYFSEDPDKERGDDWNDAPWQSNAGPPYGRTRLRVVPFQCDGLYQTSSDVSIEDLQKGKEPWLKTWNGDSEIRGRIPLPAFIEHIEWAMGECWSYHQYEADE